MKKTDFVVKSQRRAEADAVLRGFSAVTYQKNGGYAYATGFYETTLAGILAEKLSKKDYDETMAILRKATTQVFLEN
jgi:hypothetical protein